MYVLVFKSRFIKTQNGKNKVFQLNSYRYRNEKVGLLMTTRRLMYHCYRYHTANRVPYLGLNFLSSFAIAEKGSDPGSADETVGN
jgi:hypothetical protein